MYNGMSFWEDEIFSQYVIYDKKFLICGNLEQLFNNKLYYIDMNNCRDVYEYRRDTKLFNLDICRQTEDFHFYLYLKGKQFEMRIDNKYFDGYIDKYYEIVDEQYLDNPLFYECKKILYDLNSVSILHNGL